MCVCVRACGGVRTCNCCYCCAAHRIAVCAFVYARRLTARSYSRAPVHSAASRALRRVRAFARARARFSLADDDDDDCDDVSRKRTGKGRETVSSLRVFVW